MAANNGNQLAVRSSFDGVISYNVKVGKDGTGVAELTTEAAIIKGGAALAAAKDLALETAFSKAVNGKYRAASEILSVAFPSQAKAFVKLHRVTPWASKQTMASYIEVMENAEPGKSGNWNAKQVLARALMGALRNLPTFHREYAVVDVAATEVKSDPVTNAIAEEMARIEAEASAEAGTELSL